MGLRYTNLEAFIAQAQMRDDERSEVNGLSQKSSAYMDGTRSIKRPIEGG